MQRDVSFDSLMSRVRAGDEDAAAELIRLYEPEVKREIRLRMSDPRLRRVLDSVDIFQSVLANFFVRAANGQFELERPDQLIRLLVTMARNRVGNHIAHHQSQRRDTRRVNQDSEATDQVADHDPSPSQVVANRELLEVVRSRLSPKLRTVAEQRALGRQWADIAAELGESPEALRKMLGRAVNEIAEQLGLDGIE